MTVRDLINGSLRLLGVLAAGETPSAQEQTDALLSLNDMIDSFSLERLIIPSIVRESFLLTPSKQTYTMGSSLTADFNTTRPLKIENALLGVNGAQQFEIPVAVYNRDQFASIQVKSSTSSLPMCLYPDNAYPLLNINLWPVPSVANNLILYSWKALSQFATVNDTISLPPGYTRMLRYNLAVELGPEYARQIDPAVIAIAVAGKENVKRMNIEPLYLSLDPALSSSNKPFNWLTGDTI